MSTEQRARLRAQGQPGPSAPAATSCCWDGTGGAAQARCSCDSKENQAHKLSWRISMLFSIGEIKSNSFPSPLPSTVFNILPFYF